MSNNSRPLPRMKLFIVAAVLCAAAAAIFLIPNSATDGRDAAAGSKPTSPVDVSIGRIGQTGPRGPQPHTSSASVPSGEAAIERIKTKSADRSTDLEATGGNGKNEFWRSAKLPDDLVAASLPVLKAAVLPEPGASKGKSNFATDVPAAFANEEDFDYKRANEELYLWLVTEPEAASAWLSEQEDRSKYDMAFALVADAMGFAGRADLGDQWASLIPDPAKRESALVGMYAGMVSRNEAIPKNMRERVMESDQID